MRIRVVSMATSITQYWIQTQSVREHIQGSWARDLFNSLSAEDQSHMLHEVGQYTLQLICGWSDVQAELDERNNAGSIAPPVLPAQFVKLRTGTFISDVLDKYRAHIGLYCSAENVEQVEADHRVNDVGLVKAYNQEPSTKALIDENTLKTNFNDAWESIVNHFTFLRRFSGGLAVAFSNTTSVESDFSVLKWENDNFR
ncbi:hypothetical protein PsorP6_017091 [Peronosclerospora sorghi]|uniref:Uncharacterized protein n=1 Tax=Peronosclerospora sorghi TaxID=230839 RepID=A0ACC0WDY3_9STRA|nr:hypothetical protein PsorP6_017091 [Peronosclerospora sorghi]